jgi:formate hydrogenlyase transcriptional activator
MSPASAMSPVNYWLIENGPAELEQVLRTIVFYPSAPIVIVDSDGICRDASVGASKLLGLPRTKLIGQKAEARVLSDQIETNLEILPERHVLLLRNNAAQQDIAEHSIQDYAFCLVDTVGHVAAWYSGAERMFGYTAADVLGRNLSCLYPNEELDEPAHDIELKRAAMEGHFGIEGWRMKKDGSRFWANVVNVALRDEHGLLQGYGLVCRDFTNRHERDEKLRRSLARTRAVSKESAVAGIVSGEFDHVPEANDAFLAMVGYSRDDLDSGLMNWSDLTPPEYAPLDELAHEEGLRFGACTPIEKELLRKDGSRIRVLAATAVLKVSPFRWISFIQDLSASGEPAEPEGEPSKDFGEIIGGSASLRRVQQQVELVAPTDATVLILGETGTGKELVARAIHRLSPRSKLPFVTLNCAAIPTGLLESELFGYERGAFTGALSQKIGRFEMAHKGTLFLDEVGDIPIDLQPKLLRALQEKSFERLGGTKTIPIDVRLVAATNRNLTQMMGDKLFRSDLYYRLKVFPITTPPLRDRPDDIPALIRHFAAKYAQKMGRTIDKIPPETIRAFLAWKWPGNVRELENFVERSVILSSGTTLRAPLDEIREDATLEEVEASGTLEQVERTHILKTLRECGGVVTTAAVRLGLHRTTLNAILLRLGISRKDF